MNRLKIILGYILAFIASIIVVCLIGLIVLKITVADKNYIKKELDNNKYYEKINKEILDKMEYYMASSGLPNDILEDIFTIEDIKNDVNSLIDNAYLGQKNVVNVEKVKKKINNNIDNYISDHEVKLTSESYLNSFVDKMVSFYEQEVNLYGMVNGYVGYIPKLENIINTWLIGGIIIFIILIIILVLLKVNYIGSIFVSSGLIILFVRMIFLEKIDYENILIISKNFSEMIKIFINRINSNMLIGTIIVISIGFILILLKSFKMRFKNV